MYSVKFKVFVNRLAILASHCTTQHVYHSRLFCNCHAQLEPQDVSVVQGPVRSIASDGNQYSENWDFLIEVLYSQTLFNLRLFCKSSSLTCGICCWVKYELI